MSPWLGFFLLVLLLTAAGILLPLFLWHGRNTTARSERALQVHRERLAQIARDRDAGLIGPSEAEGAEAEIKRAMLTAARERGAEDRETGEARSPWPVAGLGVAALALGVVVYAGVGSYGAPDRPLAERSGAGGEHETQVAGEPEGERIREVIARLRERLEETPDDAEAWRLLGRSYAAIGRTEQAIEAYRRVLAIAPGTVAARGDLGEALVRRAGGRVGPEAVAQFEEVRTDSPGDPRARYYLALAEAQSGNHRAAAEGFAALLREAPADAPYRAAVREILDRVVQDGDLDRASLDIPGPAGDAPRGPTAEEVEAAQQMSREERLAMIRSMVDRLETRLADEPGDVEGWLRLARSKAVLGQRAEAVAALEKGLAANPGAAALEQALTELRGAP